MARCECARCGLVWETEWDEREAEEELFRLTGREAGLEHAIVCSPCHAVILEFMRAEGALRDMEALAAEAERAAADLFTKLKEGR